MKKKYNQIIALMLCTVMCLSMPFSSVKATTIDSLNQKIKQDSGAISDAKGEKKELQSGLDKIQEKKDALVEQKRELSSYVQKLDGEMTQVVSQIAQIEEMIAQKQAEVSKASEDLEQAKEDVKQQYENMKIRIKFMYEHGNTTPIQIILGAGSFSEMLNKAEYIEELSNYDRMMLVQFEETKEKVKKLEANLKDQEKVLEENKAIVEEKQAEMSDLIDEKSAEISEFEADIKDKEKAIKEYEDMIAEQDATIKALEAQVAAAQKEKDRLSVSGNSTLTYGGGPFCFPAPKYVRASDDYGYRIHPILGVQQFHNGVDLAAPSGSPILAAADGIVIAASYSATMGNYIMIDHGSGLYTIYMHASALYVSQGAKVSKGSQIAAVGSTGRSTGAHLHFSVRKNGSYVSPWSYL